MKKFFDSLSPSVVALLQTFGVFTYLSLFSFAVIFRLFEDMSERVPEFAGPILALGLFIFSALATGSMVLGYPITLFFEGARTRAVHIVLWCIVWIGTLLSLAAASFFLFV